MLLGASAFGSRTFAQDANSAHRTIALSAASSPFVFTANAVSTAAVRLFTAALATFALFGFPSLRRVVFAHSVSAFAFVGVANTFVAIRTLTIGTGAFVLSGKTVTFTAVRKLTAAVAAFVLAGIATTGTSVHGMSAASAAFVLSGKTAVRNISKAAITRATFALTGFTIVKRFLFPGSTAAFVLTGRALVIAYIPVTAAKLLIRRTKFLLQQIRVTPPTLDQ